MIDSRARLLSAAILTTMSFSFLGLSKAAAAQEAGTFIEQPGVRELSGALVVRRWTVEAWTERGEGAAAKSHRQRAAERLNVFDPEVIAETDEYLVRVPAGENESSLAAKLLATGDYQYVEPDWLVFPTDTVPNDPEYFRLWHHPKMRSPAAWDLTTGLASFTIAIVDSGVEKSHPDLAAALVPGYNSKDRLPESQGGQVDDLNGHGTFVAGCAAAIGNNGTAVVGVGWSFRIMPVRYSNDPCGCGVLSDLLAGARWAARNGAQVVNISQTGVASASVETTGAVIRSLGGLLFYAADNSGTDHSGFDWPNVTIVGATNKLDGRPSWSSYGKAVDVFAPGNQILSTGINHGIAFGSGTSAASPIAAGLAALIWSVKPWLSADQVEQYLFEGCKDLGPVGEDDEWGWGRIDSFSSVDLAANDAVLAYSQDPLLKGQSSTAVVQGAQPAQSVHWLLSLTGAGPGPCFQGKCLDILAPWVVFSLPADPQGIATWTFTVPPVTPIALPVWVQAITLDATLGLATSNVVFDVVL